mmetsp:Transcript_44749/g.103511  ORF Transcript_44749/g.103511 Transcript_44749/m.103511 type:complete len:255 (+) Transcript_44749:61-825(+)
MKAQESKDEFTRIKVRMYELLQEVRENIAQRKALIKSRGNCMESIQKGHAVRQQLQELNESLTKLQAILRKQRKRIGRKSAEVNEDKYLQLRQLKKLVDEAQALFDGELDHVSIADDIGLKPTLFGNSSLREAAKGERDRDMTDEERRALDVMKQRDQDLDIELGKIGLVAGRLGEVAAEMGVSADRQKEKVENINNNAERENQRMEMMNKKIQEVIKYERRAICGCRSFLIFALLGVVAVIVLQLGVVPSFSF